MPFPTDHYDPETLALMRKAFDAAWQEVGFALRALAPIRLRSAP